MRKYILENLMVKIPGFSCWSQQSLSSISLYSTEQHRLIDEMSNGGDARRMCVHCMQRCSYLVFSLVFLIFNFLFSVCVCSGAHLLARATTSRATQQAAAVTKQHLPPEIPSTFTIYYSFKHSTSTKQHLPHDQ